VIEQTLQTDIGKVPISLAYHGKHIEVVELFLNRGVNVERPFDHCGAILHRASADGRCDDVQLLLRHKAEVNTVQKVPCS
jgi:ankyrin repeat protein